MITIFYCEKAPNKYLDDDRVQCLQYRQWNVYSVNVQHPLTLPYHDVFWYTTIMQCNIVVSFAVCLLTPLIWIQSGVCVSARPGVWELWSALDSVSWVTILPENPKYLAEMSYFIGNSTKKFIVGQNFAKKGIWRLIKLSFLCCCCCKTSFYPFIIQLKILTFPIIPSRMNNNHPCLGLA